MIFRRIQFDDIGLLLLFHDVIFELWDILIVGDQYHLVPAVRIELLLSVVYIFVGHERNVV